MFLSGCHLNIQEEGNIISFWNDLSIMPTPFLQKDLFIRWLLSACRMRIIIFIKSRSFKRHCQDFSGLFLYLAIAVFITSVDIPLAPGRCSDPSNFVTPVTVSPASHSQTQFSLPQHQSPIFLLLSPEVTVTYPAAFVNLQARLNSWPVHQNSLLSHHEKFFYNINHKYNLI